MGGHPRHVRRRLRCGHPSGGFRFRAILGDGLAKQLILVLRGTPATIDEELDPVVRGIGCSLAQGSEQIGVEVGYTRNLVVEDRRSVGDGTVSLAERITLLVAGAVGGRCGRRGRGCRGGREHRQRRRHPRRGADSCGDRPENDEQDGDAHPANPDPAGPCSCSLGVAHAAIEGGVVLPARMRFSIRRRYVPARSIEACAC